jgi:hypothetical protein
MRWSRTHFVLIAVLATLALSALLPATAGAATHKLGTGTAVITLDPFVAEFINAAYPFFPVAPAAIAFNSPGPRVALPITGGAWNTKPHPHGTFLLKGGLFWVHYAGTTLETFTLPAWRAGINTTAGWTALVNGTREAIFDETLTGMHATVRTIHGHKRFSEEVQTSSVDHNLWLTHGINQRTAGSITQNKNRTTFGAV